MPSSLNDRRFRARNGKIARLPHAVREQLNLKLLNGESIQEILSWVNALPEARLAMAEYFKGVAINDDNLREWRAGGFVEWERIRAQREWIADKALELMELDEAGAGKVLEGMVTMVQIRIAELMEKAMRDSACAAAEARVDDVTKLAKAAKELTGAIKELSRGQRESEDMENKRRRVERAEENLALEETKEELKGRFGRVGWKMGKPAPLPPPTEEEMDRICRAAGFY